GPVKPLVEPVVDGRIGRVGDDAAGAERARAVLHASYIDGASLAGFDKIGRRRGRLTRKPPYSVFGCQTRVYLVIVVAPEIEMVETAAALEPGGEPILVPQVTKSRSDRQSVVAHGRKNEDLLDRQRLRQEPVQADVGEQSASQREMARVGAP